MNKIILTIFIMLSILFAKTSTTNYICKVFNFKTDISAVNISKNNKLNNFFKKNLNKWKISNKYNINFFLIKGFKNYYPIERSIFYAPHYCLNSNDKYNYCLVTTPFKKHKIKMIIYPDYKKQYPYNLYGYYIDKKIIIVYLNIDSKRYNYLNQSIINSKFEIEQQFRGINKILNFFKKINKNVVIIGNFYTDKNTLTNYIDKNKYSVLLNHKNLIITNNNLNKIKIALLENTHIIIPKKQKIKIFSKMDTKIIKNFIKEYNLSKENKKNILYKYKENIGDSIPLDIQIQIKGQ